MTRHLFGTDGIRGTANRHPMTAEIALKLGLAAGRQFTRGDHRHRVVIGKDTRLSGYMLEPALTAGFISVGMDVTLTGPIPTPGIALLTRSLRADLGVMISASHNPYLDNGIKLFGPDGFKLSDDIEIAIEERMRNGSDDNLAPPDELGRAMRLEGGASGRYIESLKSSFPKGLSLSGVKIVVDCANGAAYSIAPNVFWELGADVVPIGTTPDGFNINDGCGSTYPQKLSEAVTTHGADLGIALDGDADRLVLVDELGNIIDGDQIIAMIATDWQSEGCLSGDGVVATQMSNYGLETYLTSLGLTLHRTRVGDRYVVEHMRASGHNLGGEQSGHLILTDFASTGDGILAALQVLAIMLKRQRPISDVGRPFTPLPQGMRNIHSENAIDLSAGDIGRVIASSKAKLTGHGRLLVRRSGTEPLIRVMVEADDARILDIVLGEVGDAIEQHV